MANEMPFDFNSVGDEIDLSEKPTKPPPDPNKPYIWLGGQWLLVNTDTGDGVPEELHLESKEELKQRARHHMLKLPTLPPLSEHLRKQGRDHLGRFASGGGSGGASAPATNIAGGTLRSDVPGQPGGPPLPRASLAYAQTTELVAAQTSQELEHIMGRPVPVDFAGMSPAMARETGEGLLMAAERYPHNDLKSVSTYGPGGTRSSDPRDPTFEAAAFTSIPPRGRHGDEMAFNVLGGEDYARESYRESALFGQNTVPSPTGTAVHEMGHVVSLHGTVQYTAPQQAIDDAIIWGGAKSSQDVATHIAKHVSIYAASGPEELLAEAFADVLVNGSSASPLSQVMHAAIEADLP